MPEKFAYGGTEYTLPTPKGLVFQSIAANYQLCVRDRTPIYDTGIITGYVRELVAEFGDITEPIHDADTGEDYYTIRGHFCHTLAQGEVKGWTPDERTLVEKKLLSSQSPNLHWLHTAPPVGKPWPTYDETPAAKVAELAAELGLVSEAVAYEQENKQRKTVLEALSATPEESVEDEELAAA